MKIQIVDTYYPRFLQRYYRENDLAGLPYREQRRALLSACFGTSDFYSRNLVHLGIEAEDLIANCAPLQMQWARENGFTVNPLFARIPTRWQRLPILGGFLASRRGLLSILVEQIQHSRPDILYLQDLSLIPPQVLTSLKRYVRLVIGQIACPLPPNGYLVPYDLILTSFPHYVDRFRKMGIASEYFRIGFDPVVLEKIGKQEKHYACTFVGGISPVHKRGTAFLEHVARCVDTDFFGYGAETLDSPSPILRAHHGEVWGLDMYRALARSRITLNRHIDVAENFANNMRLYEATGCGTMLLTDAKDNLHDLFEVGKEVVAYSSPEEAVELIKYYTAHPDERDAIAKAGQARTLRDHTYQIRMQELIGLLTKYLSARP